MKETTVTELEGQPRTMENLTHLCVFPEVKCILSVKKTIQKIAMNSSLLKTVTIGTLLVIFVRWKAAETLSCSNSCPGF